MRSLFTALLLSSAVTGAAHATDALLFISPLRVEIKPGQNSEVISVSNKSNQVQRYTVQALDQVMNEEGLTVNGDVPHSAKRMVRFMPRRVVLEPGQRQVVRLMVRRPADLPDGDYHTHILFEEENPAKVSPTEAETNNGAQKGARFSLGTLYSIAIPVVVQQGQVSASISLLDISATAMPNGKPVIKARFKRGGNAEAQALLTVKADGQDVISPRQVRLYREVNEAVITLPFIDEKKAYHGPAKVRLATSKEPTAATLYESTITIPQ